jgi:hypothetical protein
VMPTQKKSPQRGGFRPGSGRKSLFPKKSNPRVGQQISLHLTHVALRAARRKAAALTIRKPDIAAALGLKVITLSDCIEWCVRTATRTPLED